MPHVNIANETIVGCEKDSFEWFHEQGHIIYSKSKKGIRNTYLQGLFQDLTITFLVFAFMHIFAWILALSSIIAYWFLFFYEEMWCNKYAREKLKNLNKYLLV